MRFVNGTGASFGGMEWAEHAWTFAAAQLPNAREWLTWRVVVPALASIVALVYLVRLTGAVVRKAVACVMWAMDRSFLVILRYVLPFVVLHYALSCVDHMAFGPSTTAGGAIVDALANVTRSVT